MLLIPEPHFEGLGLNLNLPGKSNLVVGDWLSGPFSSTLCEADQHLYIMEFILEITLPLRKDLGFLYHYGECTDT